MLRSVAVIAFVALLVGCASTETSNSSAPQITVDPSARTIDPQLLEPLTALGPCSSPPPQAEHDPVPGLVLPDDAIVTTAERTDPVTRVQGYVSMTPVQVRVHYERQSGLREILVEDEIHESEVLVTDGRHRLFVKTQAVCELGSVFVAIIAPEQEAGLVPVPSGSPT